MKKFLGLYLLETNPDWRAFFRNYLASILFMGIGYFLIAMLFGSFVNDTWKYIQSVEKYYVMQAVFLLFSVVFNQFVKIGLNKLGDKFWMKPKIDVWFYPLFLIITFLVINEIGGL